MNIGRQYTVSLYFLTLSDKEIGWFYHEFHFDPQIGLIAPLKVWTSAGYKEFLPQKTQ